MIFFCHSPFCQHQSKSAYSGQQSTYIRFCNVSMHKRHHYMQTHKSNKTSISNNTNPGNNDTFLLENPACFM